MNIKKVLIPVDGSKRSLEAINYAKFITKSEGVEFHLLNVSEINYIIQQDIQKELAQASDNVVEKAASELEGFNVVKKSLFGIPYRSIVEYADDEKIDLIVMTRMGLSGLQRYLVGSVTSKVISHSSVPVLIIPEKSEK